MRLSYFFIHLYYRARRFCWPALRWLAAVFLVFMLLNVLYPPPAPPAYSTAVYDANGHMIHAWLTPDEKWRLYTELHEISPQLRQTILYKEDRWFYYHPGINPLAVGRALLRNVWRGRTTSGASTISMQVVRMLEPRPRTLWSKCAEAVRALQLEWRYSKDEILQLYLNLVPMGGNLEGIKTGAWLYFNKNPDHLSLAEITALSIVPNRPNSLRPGRHNAALLAARNQWLQRFGKAGLVDEQSLRDALAEPLTAERLPVPRLAPHLSQRLRYSGGHSIHSTLRSNTQLKAEKLVADYIRPLQLYNIRHAAVIVINNRSRAVEAYVGSANFADTIDGGQVNGAAAVRQPGSTLKPLLYGLCIDAGLTTPKMTMYDVPVNYAGYVPENYDQQFNGTVSMEYALANSLNIPAVKMLNQLGIRSFIKALAACGFEQIKKDERKLGLSMILGGCGATLEEMTGLFAAFASEGLYRAPRYLQSDSSQPPYRVLSAASAYIISEVLSNIERPDFPVSWQTTASLPRIAWKTGTSYGRRDAWSIGYNRHYTIGVWLGNFSGQGIPELSGAATATPLLFRLFNSIDYNSDPAWLRLPATLDQRIVCTETGLPPGEYCSSLATDFFIPLVSPTALCQHGREVLLSADEKISYCVECAPASGYKKKWYKQAPPELQAWYASRQLAYDKIPPHNPACQRLFSGQGPVILSPDNGAEYFIEKSNPEPLLLSCRAEADVARVYWYINNQHYKTCAPTERIFFMPTEGPVKISCTDDKGRNRDIRIQVKMLE